MGQKTRRMLGSPADPEVIALKALMDTQSRETLRRWCLGYAGAYILPLFEKLCPGDDGPRNTLKAAEGYCRGEVPFLAVKGLILHACHEKARSLDHEPAAQAAARAIGQGAAVIHVPTHALGMHFYGAAAIAYYLMGTDAKAEVYDAIAREVCRDYGAALKAMAADGLESPAGLPLAF